MNNSSSSSCNPNDIVVRLKRGGAVYPKEVGDIFQVIASADLNSRYARYNPKEEASPGFWRHATPQEIIFYNNGGRNINKPLAVVSGSIKPFLVKVGDDRKNEYKEFQKLCSKHNIGNTYFQEGWVGSYIYYGVLENNKGYKTDYLPDNHNYNIFTLEEFKINLKQLLNNEKTRIIEPVRRCKTTGSSVTSSCTRQIATASRLIGNPASSRYQKIRVKSFKIGTSAISL